MRYSTLILLAFLLVPSSVILAQDSKRAERKKLRKMEQVQEEAIPATKEEAIKAAEKLQQEEGTEVMETIKAGNIWSTLSKITFKKQMDEIMGFNVDVPVFSKDVKDLEGQEVTIKGYIIPVEGYKSHREFVFSAFPYNMCFFCGGAGPETVMEVYSIDPVKYSAKQVTLKGKLELNDDDINRLMYSLTDAVLIK